MNNDKEKLDEIYRNKFREYQLPVSDKVLSNIKKEIIIQSSKKKTAYWKWILFFSVLLISASGMYFFISDKKNITIVNNRSNEVSQQSLTVNNSETNDENKSANKNLSAIKSDVNKSIANKELANISSLPEENKTTKTDENKYGIAKNDSETKKTKQPSSAKNNNEISNNDLINKGAEKTKALNKEPLANNGNADRKKGENTIMDLSLNTTPKTQTTVAQNASKNNNKNEKNEQPAQQESNKEAQSQNSLNAATIENKENKENKAPENIDVVKEAKPEETNSTKKTLQDSVPTKKELQITNEKNITKDTALAKTNIPATSETDNKKEKKISFFMELNSGTVFSNAIINKGNQAAIPQASDDVKNLLTYNAGLDFGVLFKKGFFINTGIGIDNKGEQHKIGSLIKRNDTVYTPLLDSAGHPILDTFGHTIFDTLPGTRVDKGHNSVNVKNTYQFLRIPVMVGYCFTVKDKVFVKPSVGVTINYLLKASETYYDNSNLILVTNTKSSGLYNNISIAGRAKLDVGITLKKKFSLSIQGGYTRFLKSIYTNSSGELKPYSYDLGFGIGYKF